jgi:predicted nucleic acid-binding protein
MDTVADADPILSFARAHYLGLLQQVVSMLIVPHTVYEEIVVHGAGKPGTTEVQAASWIIRASVKDQAFVERLPARLHLGEREAIALAKERSTLLLVDEREARRQAQRQGVIVFGSLRVLKKAKDRGIIAHVKPILDELITAGTYMSDTLYHAFLYEVGEA